MSESPEPQSTAAEPPTASLVRPIPLFDHTPTDAEIAALLPTGFIVVTVAAPPNRHTRLGFAVREFPETPEALAAILREVANALTAPSLPDPDLL